MSEIVKVVELKNRVSGIYKLNYPNGKIYIGQSCDIKRRMHEHNNINRLKTHYNLPCDLAIQKYGAFEEIEILEYCPIEKLNEREIYWIAYYNSTDKNIGYNLTPGGTNACGENVGTSVFTNEQVLDIRKRRFEGERKINVYQDYKNHPFATFENIWLGRGYPHIGTEYIIEPHAKTRQEYSSEANRGERNNKAKLTEEDVREIRRLADEENWTPLEINTLYPNVKLITIRRVINRQTWKHVI